MMKIILRKPYFRFGNIKSVEDFEVNCKGSGSKDDPIIIESSLRLPADFDIMESNLSILIKDCTFRNVHLSYSKNITIDNVNFKNLFLSFCSNVKIQKVKSSWVNFHVCHNCSFENSRSEEYFVLYKSYNNILKNCEFWNFFYNPLDLSRGNIFENNDVYDPNEAVFKDIQKPLLEGYKTFSIGAYGDIIELVCKGNGTKENPAIFDANIPDNEDVLFLEIIKNRHYLIFKNFQLEYVDLMDSQHIIFENCSFSKYCRIAFCSDIKMKGINTKILEFGECTDVNFEYSDIQTLKAIKKLKGYVSLRKCIVKNIKKNAVDKIT